MKLPFVFLLVFFLFIRCSDEATVDPEVPEVILEEFPEQIDEVKYSDTVHHFSDRGEFYSYGSDSYDTLISIKQKKYRLHLESRLSPDVRILHNENVPDGDILHCYSSVSYQGFYTFSLFQGEKKVFKINLTKEDFKKAEYGLVLISDAYLPQFIEYNNAFDALIFEVGFNAEGTCWASNALLLIGLDGKVKLVDQLSGTGGNSANYNVQITPDRSRLISSTAIHYPHGKSLSLMKDDARLMGVDLFDDCLLVVYEFDEKDPQKNAYLKDYSGKTLLNFKYQGWTGGLGYSFLRTKVKDAHYFIDEVNKCLTRLRKENNQWVFSKLPFSNMIEFDGNQRQNEQFVDLSTEVTEFIFYFDTTSGQIRKITPAAR